jgi:hypothetical protein
MKATEAKEQSTQVSEKAYKAVHAMINWAAERNESEVDVHFGLVTPYLMDVLIAEGYLVSLHQSVNGLSHLISWKDSIDYEVRAEMFSSLSNTDDNALKAAIEACRAGKGYDVTTPYIDAVMRGDLKRAARLCGTGDFISLMRIKAVLL